MGNLINQFWRLCTFRAGPEDLPYSSQLFVLVLVGWVAVQGVLTQLQTQLTLAQVLGTQTIALGTILLGVGIALMFKQLLTRWLQTAMALVGVDILLSLVSTPVLLFNRGAEAPSTVTSLMFLLLVSWQLAAHSFIYHRALNIGPFLGLAMAFTFMVCGYLFIITLMPGAVAAA